MDVKMKPVEGEEKKIVCTAKWGLYSGLIRNFLKSGADCVELEVMREISSFYQTLHTAIRRNDQWKGKVQVRQRNNKIYLVRAEAVEK